MIDTKELVVELSNTTGAYGWGAKFVLDDYSDEKGVLLLRETREQRAKQLFNNWMKQGTSILNKFEANFTEDELEELSALVETSMNNLRKNIVVVD